MPTARRPARSLLALALVVNLLAASAPATVSGTQRQAASCHAPSGCRSPRMPTRTPVSATVATASRPSTMRRGAGAHRLDQPAEAGHVPDPAADSRLQATGVRRWRPPSRSFKGRNHVWIPALGIDRSVSWYACSSSFYPGNRVYRWGCAGTNNIYLFGHAHSVFKALHDAYVRGRLKKGMKAVLRRARTGRSAPTRCRGGR